VLVDCFLIQNIISMKFFHGQQSVEGIVETKLSEVYGRQVKIKSSSSLGGGCINHASKIETSEGIFFLKWNSDCPADIFVREAESLQELKKAAGGQLVVPEVIAAKEVDDTPGFLVQEYLEPGHPSGNSDEILGHGLALIHQYRNEKFGFYNNNYCGSTLQDNSWKDSWADFFRENRLRFLLNLIQKERPLPSDESKVYERLLDRIELLVPKNSAPALIHGDLWSGNYMQTKKGPALIDPASSYSDREMEMGIMTMFGGFSQRFYSAYNEVYPLPADWKDRNRLYQLYHVLNHYYLFGGGYSGQALQMARKMV
jgi:protein-ribulosamine 3-kinase